MGRRFILRISFITYFLGLQHASIRAAMPFYLSNDTAKSQGQDEKKEKNKKKSDTKKKPDQKHLPDQPDIKKVPRARKQTRPPVVVKPNVRIQKIRITRPNIKRP